MSVRFSYSRLEQYNNCPYAYNLKYNEGLYINTPNVAAPFGSLVHKLLEVESTMIKNGRPINYETLKKDFVEMNLPKRSKYDKTGDLFGTKILAEKYPSQWVDFTSKGGKSYSMRAKEFLESGIYAFPRYCEEHPELEIVGAEIGFEYEHRGYVFMGFIDRVMKVKGKDSYVIFDIKTKDTPFSDKELTTPLQFTCYANAMRKIYGKDIEINCYYELPFANGYTWQHAGTKGFEARGNKKIDALIDGIEAGKYEPAPSPLCHWCPYKATADVPVEVQGHECIYCSMWTPENHTFETWYEWKGVEGHEKQWEQYQEDKAVANGYSFRKDKGWDIEF